MSSPCRVCLSSNRRMISVKNDKLKITLQKLVNMIHDELCYICYQQLQKSQTFSVRAGRSADILLDLWIKGLEPSVESLANLNVEASEILSISPVKHTVISNESTNQETLDTILVKPEPRIEEAIESYNFNDEDVTPVTNIAKIETTNDDVNVSKLEKLLKLETVGSNVYNTDKFKSINDFDSKMLISERDIPNSSHFEHTCDICKKVYSDRYVLKEHLQTHVTVKPFKCKVCSKSFTEKSGLIKHENIHNRKRFYCALCSKSYSQKNSLKKHILSHNETQPHISKARRENHKKEKQLNASEARSLEEDTKERNIEIKPTDSQTEEKEKIGEVNNKVGKQKSEILKGDEVEYYPCIKCSKIFKQHSDLIIHLRQHKVFKCTKCHWSFDNKSTLRTHSKTHQELFPCNICSKKFTRSVNLRNHLKTHTDHKPYRCSDCDKAFSLPVYLQRHMLTHSDVKPYSCEKCGKSYVVKSNLMKHESTHRRKVFNFTCDRCAKGFTSSSNLQKHMIIHTGERPYKCDLCEKTFARKFQLSEHTRVHTREKPYVCSECGKRYTQSSSLALHRKTHSGQRPCICEVCQKTFTDRYGLQIHMRVHTGEKPYACDLCPMKFTYNCSLHEHRRRAHSLEKVSCERCYKTFTRNSHLKRHMKIHLREKSSFISL